MKWDWPFFPLLRGSLLRGYKETTAIGKGVQKCVLCGEAVPFLEGIPYQRFHCILDTIVIFEYYVNENFRYFCSSRES